MQFPILTDETDEGSGACAAYGAEWGEELRKQRMNGEEDSQAAENDADDRRVGMKRGVAFA